MAVVGQAVVGGRFVIEAVLGAGGFGEVYRVYDHATHRRVALKMLNDNAVGDPKARQRALREAAVLQRVQHPSVIRLLEYDVHDTQIYLVFDLIQGRDLAGVLELHEKLGVTAARTILVQMLGALDAAHTAGVIHRDVKPGNILIQDTPQGTHATLIDFGIARPSDHGSPGVTATGELIGTPRYMSPEQLIDAPLGPASDVYSLGIVLLEALFGREVLLGPNVQDQLPRLLAGHEFVDATLSTDPELLAVLRRMTALNASERPSARAVLRQLQGDSERVGSVSPTPVSGPSYRGAIAAIVVGVGVGGAYLSMKDTNAPPTTLRASAAVPQAQPTTEPVPAEPAAPEPDASPVNEEEVTCQRSLPPGTHQFRHSNAGGPVATVVVPPVQGPGLTPAVLVMHDGGGSAERELRHTRIAEVAARYGVTVVIPPAARSFADKLSGTWARKASRSQAWSVFESTWESLCIDPERVYVMGRGAGGRAADRMICEQDQIRAVAVFGARPRVGDQVCAHAAVPRMALSPTKSPHAPVKGGRPTGGCKAKAKISLADHQLALKASHRCTGTVNTHTVQDGVCTTWECEVPLITCEIAGGNLWKPMDDWNGCNGVAANFEYEQFIFEFLARQR